MIVSLILSKKYKLKRQDHNCHLRWGITIWYPVKDKLKESTMEPLIHGEYFQDPVDAGNNRHY